MVPHLVAPSSAGRGTLRPMTADARTRILEAAVTCLGRYGIAKTTVDDAAKEAGVARATVYRHFPDGKDQLISEAIAWAVHVFFAELAVAVDDAPDFATLLERALLFAHQAVLDHAVLQKVAETEPERLMPQLSESAPLVRAAIDDYFVEKLASERLLPGVTPIEAADWLARMGVSFIFGGGVWDLADPAAVRRLVREELLVGVLAPPIDP
jgi:AcrR family transcriptional regulator